MSYDYREKFNVAGKCCIVTGGAQGLSRGMAEGLLENGCRVVLMDIQEDKLKEVVDEYRGMGYEAFGVSGNLADREDLTRMFEDAMKLLGGRLDVLIPAASSAGGISGGRMGSCEKNQSGPCLSDDSEGIEDHAEAAGGRQDYHDRFHGFLVRRYDGSGVHSQ